MPTKKQEEPKMVGTKLPAFKAEMTGGRTLQLADIKGKKTVFYFYPKDNTPGCTTEGEDFRDNYHKFKKIGVAVFGISRDSIKSHDGFKTKYKFPFDLISDEEEKMCEIFDVMKMKSLYGRKYRGVDRSTFVVDEKGVIIREWRNVKVPGHVQEVLEFVKES